MKEKPHWWEMRAYNQKIQERDCKLWKMETIMGIRQTNKEIQDWVNKTFTKKQIEIYKLIHPDLGGLELGEAAKKLEISKQAAYARIALMRKKYPEAFRFEYIKNNKQEQIADSYKSPDEMKQLNSIISRAKQWANSHKPAWPFTLSEEDFLEIIRSPCTVCGKEGWHDGLTENGRHFKYNHIILAKEKRGFSYINSFSVCDNCKKNQSWRYLQKFKRLGF